MEKIDYLVPREEGKEDEENSGNEDEVCKHCGNQPCIVLEMKPMFLAICQAYKDEKSNKQIRFKMYSDSVKHMYGCGLGVGVRKRLPHCVQQTIHSLAPDKDYTGFKEVEDK